MPEIDITDDVVSDLGSSLDAALTATIPAHIAWDCSIAGLKFLFGFSRQYPMQRETAQFRRERIDNERDPGEQSLDSGFWIRSQASWHYGDGLSTAEPLEVNSEEARFRFYRSGGVDPWTPGELKLLHSTSRVYATGSTVNNMTAIGIGTGVLLSADTGSAATLTYVNNAGSATAVTWGGTGRMDSLASTGQYWLASDAAGIWRGTLPSGSGTKIYNNKGTPTRTLIRWVKDRAMYADGPDIHEITNLSPSSATLPTALFTHPNSGWRWTDFAAGPTSIYASGYSGEFSAIYRIGVEVTTTTVELDQPVIVAEMPRGEDVLSMYQYVGEYLIVGTSVGVRVAQINNDGSITLGPLVYDGAPVDDAVAVGRFVYFTVRDQARVTTGSLRPGLYRLNLGQVLNNTPLDFAKASDLVTPSDLTGDCVSVTVSDDKLWFAVTGTDGGLFKENSTFVPEGWVETGRIRLGTMEKKGWRDLRLLGPNGLLGSITAYASVTGSGSPSTWDPVISVSGSVTDAVGKLNVPAPAPTTDLYLAFRLQSNPECSCSAKMIGYQVRAIPAPRRAELVQVPLMCFDFETDKNGNQYGSVGLSWSRFRLLKQLEGSGATIRWTDFSTGEVAEGYVEKVTMSRVSPPSKGLKGDNIGGIVTVLLRLS